MRRDQDAGREKSLPIAEETASLDRREEVTGHVRVTTTVDSEEHVLQADLLDEQVEVTRVPVGRVVTEAPPVRTEGDVTVVPVLEEIAVVEKRLVLREELHLRRVARRHAQAIPVTLRRQRAVVERDGVPVDDIPVSPSSEEDSPT
jgi:stress response protein YsnF